jgi:hypothetical protein
MVENLDLCQSQDENARELIGRLLNLVEKLAADLLTKTAKALNWGWSFSSTESHPA